MLPVLKWWHKSAHVRYFFIFFLVHNLQLSLFCTTNFLFLFCFFYFSLIIELFFFLHTSQLLAAQKGEEKRTEKKPLLKQEVCAVNFPRLLCTRLLHSFKKAWRKKGEIEGWIGCSSQPKCIWIPVRGYLLKHGRWIADQWTVQTIRNCPVLWVRVLAGDHSLFCPFLNSLCLHAVLQLKLQQRRTREELVSQGIMPRKSPLQDVFCFCLVFF